MSVASDDPYATAGVDYGVLDAAKRAALGVAATTSEYAAERGAHLVDSSRGEPVTLVELGGTTLGFVLECLGTKSMIARAYERLTGEDRFADVAYDTVAAIVNDCCCLGALPFVVNAYFATGSATWYQGTRASSLVEGWRAGCEDAGASWGGGESPTLAGLVATDEIDLAGSAIAKVPDGVIPLGGEALRPGDEIVLVASSGLHANGASLARSVAAGLAGGLCAELPSGRLFGDALLDRSLIYVRLVERLLRGGGLHYASHLTGHGLRKLMRAHQDLTYRVERLPGVPEVLAFLAGAAGLSPREAYGTLNMGAGFALFLEAGATPLALEAAESLGLEALVAGRVEHGPRQVVLEPIGAVYRSDELAVRSNPARAG